jgi:hypothetical protein
MMTTEPSFTNTVRSLLEENQNAIRWCLNHPDDRDVPFRLRRLAMSASALALALDYKMDGQEGDAADALRRADWSCKELRFDPKFMGHG